MQQNQLDMGYAVPSPLRPQLLSEEKNVTSCVILSACSTIKKKEYYSWGAWLF